MYNSILYFYINMICFIMDHVNISTYMCMHVCSEFVGMFKYIPACYILKVCIDIPKEMIKVVCINK